jgi:hypothetical protein
MTGKVMDSYVPNLRYFASLFFSVAAEKRFPAVISHKEIIGRWLLSGFFKTTTA